MKSNHLRRRRRSGFPSIFIEPPMDSDELANSIEEEVQRSTENSPEIRDDTRDSILANIKNIKERKDYGTTTFSIGNKNNCNPSEERIGDKEFYKEFEGHYQEFMQWKVIENIFELEEKMSIFEAEDTGKFIAFRLDEKKLIKVINLPELKDYIFIEQDNHPIEFLKFIDQGQRIIIANKILIYILDLKTSKRQSFNLLARYTELHLDIDKISSNKGNNFQLRQDGTKTYLNFTIANIIFTILLPEGLSNLHFRELENDTQYLFPDPGKGILCAIAHTVSNPGLIINILKDSNLKLIKKIQVNGLFTYFSSPLFSYSSKTINLRLYFLDNSKLGVFESSFSQEPSEPKSNEKVSSCSQNPSEPKSNEKVSRISEEPSEPKCNEKVSSCSQKPSEPKSNEKVSSISQEPSEPKSDEKPESQDSKKIYIKSTILDNCSVTKVWYASDQMIIIDYSDSTTSKKSQAIFNSDLTKVIESYEVHFQSIIVENSIVLALDKNKYDASIITIGSKRFKGDFHFQFEIQSISTASSFIFINTKEMTFCYKMKIDKENHCLHKVLDENDYSRFADLKNSIKEKLIPTLCYGRDDKSLTFYLHHHKEFKENKIESLNIEDAIRLRSTECLKVLFDYLMKEANRTEAIMKNIKDNFAEILTCGASNLPDFLDSLLKQWSLSIKLVNENLPVFQFTDSKNDPSDELFSTTDCSEWNEYEITKTVIQLPKIRGSASSINITKALMESEKCIFTSNLVKHYINMKWADLWFVTLGQTIIVWTNCLLVMYLIMISPDSLTAQIGLLLVNLLLVSNEVFQLYNLGFWDYIGFKESNFFWNLSFIITLGFIFTEASYLIIPYMITRVLNLRTSFKLGYIEIIVRSSPGIAFIFLFCVPDSYVYVFFVLLGFELLIYIGSIIREEELLGRNYVKIVALIVFLGYSYDNLSITIFLSCTFVIEWGYDIYKVLIEHKKKEKRSLVIIILEVLNLTLLWLGFTLKSSTLAELSLGGEFLVNAIQWYEKFSKHESVLQLRKYHEFYSLYLLIAYIGSENNLFLISFLLFSGSEWVFQKVNSSHQLKKTMSVLVFNWNSIDICRTAITVTWIIYVFLSEKPPEGLTWVFALLNFLRGLTGFRAFNWTRFYVRLILSSVIDITSFLVIFVYINVCFGVLNFSTGKVQGSLFEVLWIIPYDMAFANFNHEIEFGLGYASFLLASLLIIIVMLNLLISILSNSYQNCQISSSELDHMEMIETIFEGEILFFWNKSRKDEGYLVICDLHYEIKEQNLISGRLQEMYQIIRKMQKNCIKQEKELPEIR